VLADDHELELTWGLALDGRLDDAVDGPRLVAIAPGAAVLGLPERAAGKERVDHGRADAVRDDEPPAVRRRVDGRRPRGRHRSLELQAIVSRGSQQPAHEELRPDGLDVQEVRARVAVVRNAVAVAVGVRRVRRTGGAAAGARLGDVAARTGRTADRAGGSE